MKLFVRWMLEQTRVVQNLCLVIIHVDSALESCGDEVRWICEPWTQYYHAVRKQQMLSCYGYTLVPTNPDFLLWIYDKARTGDFLLALILSVSSLERNYFMHFCSNPSCHCLCSHLFISRYQVVFFQILLTWTLGLLSKLEVWWSPRHLSTEPNVFGLRAKLFGWLLVLDEVWSQWALSTKQHWKLVWLGSIFRDSNRILSPSVILD